MRISDWSADVCSSDLRQDEPRSRRRLRRWALAEVHQSSTCERTSEHLCCPQDCCTFGRTGCNSRRVSRRGGQRDRRRTNGRSGELRCGKECERKCRSGWSPYHKKKKRKRSTKQ